MDLNTATPAEPVNAQEVQAAANDFISNDQPDEFAAAGARLQQRGDALHQQHLRQAARHPQHPPQYFPHLEQGYGYGLSGRGYAPSHYYTPPARQVQYTPPVPPPVHHVPTVIHAEPDPLPPEVQALPYEIDAYGNPILPEGMDLDPWGNLVPRVDYNY